MGHVSISLVLSLCAHVMSEHALPDPHILWELTGKKVLMAVDGVLEDSFTSVENGDTVHVGRLTLLTSPPFLLDRLGSLQRGHTLCIFLPDIISDSNLEAPLTGRQGSSGVRSERHIQTVLICFGWDPQPEGGGGGGVLSSRPVRCAKTCVRFKRLTAEWCVERCGGWGWGLISLNWGRCC